MSASLATLDFDALQNEDPSGEREGGAGSKSDSSTMGQLTET